MRLSAEILLGCPQVCNAIKEREICIRGRNIQNLEEGPLRQLDDSFDTIDLSDNSLVRLDSFPPMDRLTMLILHKNRLTKITAEVPQATPNLTSIVAHDNLFDSLEQLVVLRDWKELLRVSFIGNPVAKVEHYRLFLIWLCPKLKLIDFARVLDVERVAAAEQSAVFAEVLSGVQKKSLMNNMMMNNGNASSSSEVGNTKKKGGMRKRSRHAAAAAADTAVSVGAALGGSGGLSFEAQWALLEEQLGEAETLEEITRIEQLMTALEEQRA